MSFSKSVKQELVGVRLRNKQERLSQLYGLTHTVGVMKLAPAFGIEYVSESHDVCRQIAALATMQYRVDASVALREIGRTRQTIVTLYGKGVEKLLTDAGLFCRTEAGVELKKNIPNVILENSEAKRAFLRGAFLGAGSINSPRRAYHLEIVCGNEALANGICEMMRCFDCEAKTVSRKDKVVVYLKEGDKISTFLIVIGASQSILRYEETRVEKDLRNYLNRANNCETANIGKTVNAATEQIAAIRRLYQNPYMAKRMSPVLKETAELRLNNPDMSLNELAALSGVGRSGVNHRLQRLLRMAEELPD